jgi:hypothetical protein
MCQIITVKYPCGHADDMVEPIVKYCQRRLRKHKQRLCSEVEETNQLKKHPPLCPNCAQHVELFTRKPVGRSDGSGDKKAEKACSIM